MDYEIKTYSIEVDTSMIFLIKMCFIYSALMDGWRVEKLSNSKFSFSKKNVLKEISLKSFINKHLDKQLFTK
jgi:hypothetical protein